MTRTPFAVPNENLTTYTSVDGAADFTIIADRVTWTTLIENQVSYVFRDFGVGYFSGDFNVTCHVVKTADVGWCDGPAILSFWNELGGILDLDVAGESGIYVKLLQASATAFRLYMAECDAGTIFENFKQFDYADYPDGIWIRLMRTGNILQVFFYDHEGMINTVAASILTLHDIVAFRYFYPLHGEVWNRGGPSTSGYNEDVKIHPAYTNWRSGFEYPAMDQNTDFEEITSPGWWSLNNKRFYRGVGSIKGYSRIGGPSGRVRTGLASLPLIYNDTLYQRIYFYVEEPWTNEYIVPITFYSAGRVEYLMWITIHPSYIRVRKYYPADHTTQCYGYVPEAGKWYYLELGMRVHASEGWYRTWFGEAHKQPDLIDEETGLDTSGATDVGDRPKQFITHFGTGGTPDYFYMDQLVVQALNRIGPEPSPKWPTRLQSSE